MTIKLAITTSGRFKDYARQKREDAAKAVTAAVTAGTNGFKTDFRQQLARAFPESNRAPNIVGSAVFPKSPRFSLGAAGTIFPRGKPGSIAYKIVQSFSEGVTIRARSGKYLAIPTDAVPTKRGSAGRPVPMTPQEVELYFDRDLEFLPATRRGVGLLVLPGRIKGQRARRRVTSRLTRARKSEADRVMFILVRSARIPKRLDPDSLGRKWADAVPDLIDRALPRDF